MLHYLRFTSAYGFRPVSHSVSVSAVGRPTLLPWWSTRRYQTTTDPTALPNKAAVFQDYGRPVDVLQVVDRPVTNFGPDKLLLKILAAPINPADINQIEGVYPVKPTFDPLHGAVAGNECVAEIVAVGDRVTCAGRYRVGDWVIPLTRTFGTWQMYTAVDPTTVYPFAHHDVPLYGAASLAVNPSTAYRMLRDFTTLSQGDYVIQSAANSAVGQAVIQLCRAWGYRTVNVIRGDRPDLDATVAYLKSLGADLVLTTNQLSTAEIRAHLKSLDAPIRLGLDCTAGRVSTELARALGPGAPLVMYGGMSRQPLTFPVSLFIFRDLQVRGFWMTRWYQGQALSKSSTMREAMWDELLSLLRTGALRPATFDPVPWPALSPEHSTINDDNSVLLSTLREAVSGAGAAFANRKKILVMDPS